MDRQLVIDLFKQEVQVVEAIVGVAELGVKVCSF